MFHIKCCCGHKISLPFVKYILENHSYILVFCQTVNYGRLFVTALKFWDYLILNVCTLVTYYVLSLQRSRKPDRIGAAIVTTPTKQRPLIYSSNGTIQWLFYQMNKEFNEFKCHCNHTN